MKKQFIGQTIGMRAYHPNLTESRLVTVEYYKTDKGILLVPVSGHNGAVIKQIKQATISSNEFNNRDHDPYNNQTEFFWAIGKLGFEFSNEE